MIRDEIEKLINQEKDKTQKKKKNEDQIEYKNQLK
jgi:hypothetical protein